MKYRDHKGSLNESMKTVIDVTCEEDIINHLIENSPIAYTPVITIQKYGYDSRIKWDAHIVRDQFGVVGFTDGPIPK